jgi:hypothetical protein
LYGPRGEALRPGRYEIDDVFAEWDGRRLHGRLAVWDWQLNANPKTFKAEIGEYYIGAFEGSLDLVKIESTRAVGHFSVRARKRWSM